MRRSKINTGSSLSFSTRSKNCLAPLLPSGSVPNKGSAIFLMGEGLPGNPIATTGISYITSNDG